MNRVAISIFFFLALFACGEDPLSYPNSTGDIVGYFQTIDKRGVFSEDAGSVIVQLSGRTQRIQFNTDGGEFVFRNVPAGNYTLKILKEGYEAYERKGLQHIGGTVTQVNRTDQRIVVAQKPDLEIAEWEISPFQGPNSNTLDTYLTITLRLSDPGYQGLPATVLFVAENPGVTPENYVEIYFHDVLFQPSPGEFLMNMDLLGHRFIKGKRYYAKLFPYNRGSVFLNTETGKLIVPSLGQPGSELSFVIPE